MIPIVFCASLAPCIRLKPAADTSCSRRNQLVDAARRHAAEDPEDRRHQAEADDQADERRRAR